jgi:hypothetical protein
MNEVEGTVSTVSDSLDMSSVLGFFVTRFTVLSAATDAYPFRTTLRSRNRLVPNGDGLSCQLCTVCPDTMMIWLPIPIPFMKNVGAAESLREMDTIVPVPVPVPVPVLVPVLVPVPVPVPVLVPVPVDVRVPVPVPVLVPVPVPVDVLVPVPVPVLVLVPVPVPVPDTKNAMPPMTRAIRTRTPTITKTLAPFFSAAGTIADAAAVDGGGP